jgi:hypothetical protein
MKAIYQGHLATITDDYGSGVALSFHDNDKTARVPFGAPSLIVDPTDSQVEAARAGNPVPPDPQFDREVRRDAARMLVQVAGDTTASPRARAAARGHLAELRKNR